MVSFSTWLYFQNPLQVTLCVEHVAVIQYRWHSYSTVRRSRSERERATSAHENKLLVSSDIPDLDKPESLNNLEKVSQHYAGLVCDKPQLVCSPAKLLGRQWVSECSAPSRAALSTDLCVTPCMQMVLQPLPQLQSSYTEPGDKTEITQLCKSK